MFLFILHTSYFPSDGLNGGRGSNSNVIHNEFEYYFLIICRYLNLVKKMRGILFFSTANGKFTSHYNNNKFGTDYGGNICYIHCILHERGAQNVRIKV